MILEYCQMLCTAVSVNPNLQNKLGITEIPYKKSHVNHPCTRWVGSTYANFAWLVAYTHALHEEYRYRYNREHLSYRTLKNCKIITSDIIAYGNKLSILELNPPLVMPDDCKTDSIIESYRNYYQKYKSQLFSWTKRDKPDWIAEITS
jgi:hypothetical protein